MCGACGISGREHHLGLDRLRQQPARRVRQRVCTTIVVGRGERGGFGATTPVAPAAKKWSLDSSVVVTRPAAG